MWAASLGEGLRGYIASKPVRLIGRSFSREAVGRISKEAEVSAFGLVELPDVEDPVR